MIDGILITPLKRIHHPKGDVFHAMKASSEGFSGFGEAYFSVINHGEIKGWKRHNRLGLNIVVPVGEIQFVIFDGREASPTHGIFSKTCIGKDNYSRLTLPPGVWVAFRGLDVWNLLLNIIAEEHDYAESDNAELSEIPYEW